MWVSLKSRLAFCLKRFEESFGLMSQTSETQAMTQMNAEPGDPEDPGDLRDTRLTTVGSDGAECWTQTHFFLEFHCAKVTIKHLGLEWITNMNNRF